MVDGGIERLAVTETGLFEQLADHNNVAETFEPSSFGDLLRIDHAQRHVIALLDRRDERGVSDDQTARNDSVDAVFCFF